MDQTIPRRACELLLSAMHPEIGEDGLRVGFLLKQPDELVWQREIKIRFYFRRREMIRAVLYIRRHGPAYLRSMSLKDVWSLLSNFVTKNYRLLGEETISPQFSCHYNEFVSAAAKARFAETLAVSEIFSPQNELTLFPLVSIRIESNFDHDSFFLIKPKSFHGRHFPPNSEKWINLEEFPPLANWMEKRERPISWLGIQSPTIQAASKLKAAILGAVALTPCHRNRYLYSMRSIEDLAPSQMMVSRQRPTESRIRRKFITTFLFASTIMLGFPFLVLKL